MNRKLFSIVVFLVFAFCLQLQSALAAGSSTTTYIVCGNSTSKAITVRSGKKCKKNETKLSLDSFQGATGATGATGTRGESAFDAIPSGKSVYGVIGVDGDTSNANSDWYAFASFPGIVSKALTDDDVIFASNSTVDNDCGAASCLSSLESALSATCTGTYDNPTAPAGKVCVYPVQLRSDKIAADTIRARPLRGASATATPGIMVNYTTNATGDTYLQAVWAYTAP